jgi:hypothetical protein
MVAEIFLDKLDWVFLENESLIAGYTGMCKKIPRMCRLIPAQFAGCTIPRKKKGGQFLAMDRGSLLKRGDHYLKRVGTWMIPGKGWIMPKTGMIITGNR